MKILHKSKRALPPLPQVAELINKLIDTPNDDLHEVLGKIDVWKWPRSDLNAWIKVLNKFDAILEEVIRDYDIDKIQVNVLTPLTKKTVCEVLRFERLLLENSTNRKTFNSYDRLQSLLSTSDLDVLILALNLLLRPAQQYSAQHAVSSALNISTPRLTSLAKRWPNLREFDINLTDLVGDKGKIQLESLPVEAREVNFTFYPKPSSSSASDKENAPEGDVFTPTSTTQPQPSSRKVTLSSAPPASGAVTVHIGSQTLESKSVMDILADVVETHSVPDDEKFELLCRIRGAQALSDAHVADREKLVIVRLLATAIFGHTHAESQAQSSLFIFEPDLIAHTAELLQLDQGIDYQVQGAAIAALDALGRYKNKIQEVLTAVNAGVNHGILMALLRKTIGQVSDPDTNIPQPFVEGLLAFMTFIATHSSGGNMVVGAGLVPLLIQVIENRHPNRLYVVSKTMQLVDNVLYGFTNAFQLFCNVHGVDALVGRIEYEVDLDLAEFGGPPIPEGLVTYGKLSVARAAVLKHILRSMHRMMQSSGSSEGLRGLLDSTLLKSVKKIMENRSVFGPSILPIAINIMSTFVHNEPTCLNVIQEAGLPDTFYKIVEFGLEPVIEVIQCVPNAVGALCLNQVGQEQLAARTGIIPSLFSIFTSERHQRVLQEKENAVLIGTGIEELIRHHPSLKDRVFDAIKTTLGTIEDLGKAYVIPDELKQWYTLQPVPPVPAAEPITTDTDVVMDSTEPESAATLPTGVPALNQPSSSFEDEINQKSHDNIITSYIDAFCKFLEGFFQHIPHCRDFVTTTDGLQRLGRLTALPSLPYDFPGSIASDSLVQVVRTAIESATTETLIFLVALVNESLAETKELREAAADGRPVLLSMIENHGEAAVTANENFRKLITLHTRVMLLSDVFTTSGYQGRAATTLLQALVGRGANDILLELGSLHRSCVWDDVLLRFDPVFGSNEVIPGWSSLVDLPATPALPSTPIPGLNQPEPSSATSATNGAQGRAVASVSSATLMTQVPKKDGPKDQNARALKHLASQIPSAMASFFQAIVRLFQTRRSADSTQKQRILEAASAVAEVIQQHLSERECENKVALISYYTLMLGLTSVLLHDDRGTPKYIHAVVLSATYRKGGIDSIISLARFFAQVIAELSEIKVEDRSEANTQLLVPAQGGLKVALHLLQPIIMTKPIAESAQASLLTTSDKKDTHPDYFEPRNFVVKLRLTILPLLRELWEAPWLISAPLSVTRSVTQVVLELLNTEGELKTPTTETGPSAAMVAAGLVHRQPPPGPDENRIRQLTDMGFPRSAAERALIRARNNVSAATELLVAHPFPLPPDPEPNEPPAPPAPEPTGENENMEANEEAGGDGDRDGGGDAEAPPEAGPSEPQQVEPEEAPKEEEVVGKTPDEWLKELNEAREPLKEGLGRRALALVDEHHSLVFDVQRVFIGPSSTHRDQSVRCIIDDIKAFSTSAYDHQEHPMSVRCRILAMILGDPSSPLASMPETEAKDLMGNLLALLLSNPPAPEGGHPTIPKWLAAHLLVVEAILVAGSEPREITLPKEGEPVPQEETETGPYYPEARSVLFDFCLRVLVTPSLPRDELLSVLRIFVLLTRDHKCAAEFVKRDGITDLFRCVKQLTGTSTAVGMHPYIAMILRHVVEDSATLQHIMRQEIRRFFTHPRNRSVDPVNYVRNSAAMALRNPQVFLQTTEELCQLSNPYGTSTPKSISLKSIDKPAAAEPSSTTAGPSETTTEMQVDEPAAPLSGVHSESLDALVHFLVAELIKSVRTEQAHEVTTSSPLKPAAPAAPLTSTETDQQLLPPTTEAKPADEAIPRPPDYAYSCFLMQTLTELLFSYDSCKLAFLSYSPKKRIHTPAKDAVNKHRTAALQFLISELITFGTLNPQALEAKRQVSLCNWAMSVVVALCVDTFPTHDIKDVPPDRVSVRKFVLEALSRAIKDLPASESAEARYSRLLALSDLCYRLISVRFNSGSRKTNEDTPTHLAKVMLEKNFVATLTNALAEVDLNYPNIRSVVAGILRPLEYLTKIAIRMSRVSEKQKDSVVEPSDTSGSEESDQDEDVQDEQVDDGTPDLYRNSSLGMYGGEMDDAHYPHEDEMDEDEEDEEDDVEMDYDDETGSEDTSATDEDEVDDLEDELEHETGESEEGWQNGEDEGDEGLVENDDGNDDEDEDDDGEDEGEDDGDDGVLWQGAAVGDDPGDDDVGEDGDEDADDTIPIMPADVDEEGGSGSEGEVFDEGLGLIDMQDEGPAAPNFLVTTGFPGAFADGLDGNGRDIPHMFWGGPIRGTRRSLRESDFDFFGRPRGQPSPPVPEASVHPLLLDPSSTARGSSQSRTSRRTSRGAISGLPHELLQSIENVIGEGAFHLFQHIITAQRGLDALRGEFATAGLIPPYPPRNGRNGFTHAIRLERPPRGDIRVDLRGFEPLVTIQRWAEEAKTFHGKFESSRLSKLANHINLVLLPAAIEALKKAKLEEEEAEKRRIIQVKAEEEAAEKARQEELAEKARLEAQREEEARAAEALEEQRRQEEQATQEAQDPQQSAPDADADTEMADATNDAPILPQDRTETEAVPSTEAPETEDVAEAPAEPEAGTSRTEERVTVLIHGNPVDITDTGIDPTFLEALPDDMREEVLNQHVRDQRAARVERPADSQISPEFLDALPPELRAEIIQQESIERARQRPDVPAITTTTGAPSDMDPASFIASLDPQLRQVILMDSDDVFIQSLPSHMIAEAGIYRDNQRNSRTHIHTHAPPRAVPPQAQPPKTPAPRDAIQLLDKPAIAVLVRLLFFPEVLRKNLLSKVLVNLCENSKTRTDIFNLLLSILQDGTGDLATIDKSFAQMSVRNTKPPLTPKAAGKQRMPSEYFTGIALPQAQNEVVPELVAQRCLETLTYIVGSNEFSSMFFLTEHELPIGLRRGSSKKGKGKEKQIPQTHFPIVLLLGLLDRQSLLKTPSLMEYVVALLALITRPLASLQDKTKTELKQPEASSSAPAPAPAAPAPTQPSDDTPSAQAPQAPTQAETPAGSASAPAAPQPQAPPPAEDKDKVTLSSPPVIPQNILRLIVNILTAGECSGRTFSHSLVLIQNLSYIPDAREVIAQELRTRAQEFGSSLYHALDELAVALQEGRSDAVTSAVASKFSPASSDQAKLLRVLKTIDYMYSPKLTPPSSETPNQPDVEKLQSIYESFRFTALWRRLGDCLAIIEEKANLEHVATVLLPLIEALMVVCKYVGSQISSTAAVRAIRASTSPRSPTTPHESMEELFVSFTDANRKVLNLMVRNNPSLMSGSFSLLVHNPRVLDFDNKRNYFGQQLHKRPHTREHYGTLQLNVRRQRVFEDSFQYLQRKTGEQIKYGKLSIRFYDEEGVDAGGVTREWFQILARQMFDPNYALFQPCAADRLTYQPNKASYVNPEHLSFFKFVGRVIGKAIYDGRLLDAYFARSLHRQILGKPVDYRDVEWVDPEYYNSLCWILENDPSALDLTFNVEAEEFGVTKIVELKEGGTTIPVTQENKREFVQLSAQYRLYSSIKEQIESLLAGFYEIIPKDLITIFDEKELELLISGTPDIDVDEWRAATEYNGYTSSDPVIVWWWRALKSFNREERAKVLSFATGTSRVPLGGFVELQGVQGVQRFSIHRAYGDTDRLPQAHTCFNQIDLPQYSSYEMLRQQLLLAINEGGEGFGFA